MTRTIAETIAEVDRIVRGRIEVAWWPSFRPEGFAWRLVAYRPAHVEVSPRWAACHSVTRLFADEVAARRWIDGSAPTEVDTMIRAVEDRRIDAEAHRAIERLELDADAYIDPPVLVEFGRDEFAAAMAYLGKLGAGAMVFDTWAERVPGGQRFHVRTLSRPWLVLSEQTAKAYALRLVFESADLRRRWITECSAVDWPRWVTELANDRAAFMADRCSPPLPCYRRFVPSIPAEVP